ncbi:LPS biosynthesis transferase [Bordetella genomosp. 9]|uniref:LPS biosynthesis transferase n=1 Tax=Bordetella genomosp. 9 TaxID=1416803 RepID=A0A261R5B9_9BORD|nr:glycosyltransferase [Bordetella genomosp. 9]OZI20219.1 LPS biosynthesis transferase [Bordetella genomosp. 9]
MPHSPTSPRPLRILTWHVHANYLYALTRVPHEFVVPVRAGNPPGYGALGTRIPWGGRVREIDADAIRDARFDCVVYQSRATYEERERLLSPRQLSLPCAYIEHDPPMPHPTDTAHGFRHERGILVHVTHYNHAAWDNGAVRTAVIEHGVPAPRIDPRSTRLARGITVVNHLRRRGRRMGADLFEQARAQVPLDLIGMDAQAMGGLGEIPNMEVGAFVSRYRFFYSPIRYTSLGLALIEAMMAGLPVVGFAATELARVIVNGRNGYIDTDADRLVDVMKALIDEPRLAADWGAEARNTALERYGMDRFVADWTALFARLIGDTQ